MSLVVANAALALTALQATRGMSIEEILADIQSNPPGEEAIARAHRVIADGTTGPTFRENTLNEIRQLSQTVLQIEQHFATISNLIRNFDSKQAIRDQSNRPIRFFPQWNSYCELYTGLLQSSQATATQLKMKIDDLLINLIPLINDPRVSLNDKHEELRGFIEDLGEFQTRGNDKAREFQRLREGVKNFHRNLIKEVKVQTNNVRARLNAVDESITQLEAELEASSGFFAACCSVLNIPTALGSISFSAGAGGFAGMIALAPVASTLLVVGGLGALGYGISHGLEEREREMQGKKDRILHFKLERDSLMCRQEDLAEISAEMIQLTSNFNEIFNRLGTMQQIWTMIRSDAVGLQEAMHQLRNARTTAGFYARIRNVEKLWHTLAWALDNYALGVASA